jgi:GNAT superfamily N-acetyltransferase
MGVEMSSERRAYLSDQAGRRAVAETFIYEVDGKATGTMTLVPPSPESEAWIDGAWAVSLLAVSPQMQGRGIARELFAVLERNAVTAGATLMCLHARRGISNQARLYSGLGYVRDPAGDIDGRPFQEGYVKTLLNGSLQIIDGVQDIPTVRS